MVGELRVVVLILPSVFSSLAGHKPYAVKFSSDYFQQLYDWAVKLIKRWAELIVMTSHDPSPFSVMVASYLGSSL